MHGDTRMKNFARRRFRIFEFENNNNHTLKTLL